MRFAILSALLLAAATPRAGCGDGAPAAPAPRSSGDCAGKWCGAPCNPCAPDRVCPTFAPTACDGAGHCATDTPWLCYDPCAGKVCGAPCHLCPPGKPDCLETMELKACDRTGRCVAEVPWLCYDPCAGRACGAECRACPPDRLDCGETGVVKACNAAGACVPRTPELACPAP